MLIKEQRQARAPTNGRTESDVNLAGKYSNILPELGSASFKSEKKEIPPVHKPKPQGWATENRKGTGGPAERKSDVGSAD
jgi:hypothetical protein